MHAGSPAIDRRALVIGVGSFGNTVQLELQRRMRSAEVAFCSLSAPANDDSGRAVAFDFDRALFEDDLHLRWAVQAVIREVGHDVDCSVIVGSLREDSFLRLLPHLWRYTIQQGIDTTPVLHWPDEADAAACTLCEEVVAESDAIESMPRYWSTLSLDAVVEGESGLRYYCDMVLEVLSAPDRRVAWPCEPSSVFLKKVADGCAVGYSERWNPLVGVHRRS